MQCVAARIQVKAACPSASAWTGVMSFHFVLVPLLLEESGGVNRAWRESLGTEQDAEGSQNHGGAPLFPRPFPEPWQPFPGPLLTLANGDPQCHPCPGPAQVPPGERLPVLTCFTT
jgi:hypothetical protein